MTKDEILAKIDVTDHPTALEFLKQLFSETLDQAYANGRESVREEMADMLEQDAEDEFSAPIDANMYELFYAMAKRIREMDDVCDECQKEEDIPPSTGN